MLKQEFTFYTFQIHYKISLKKKKKTISEHIWWGERKKGFEEVIFSHARQSRRPDWSPWSILLAISYLNRVFFPTQGYNFFEIRFS